MSTTPIDASALAQARERLHYAAESALDEERTYSRARASDLRLVLDALKDARGQAFEDAAKECERLSEGDDWSDCCAKRIRALAAKEQA